MAAIDLQRQTCRGDGMQCRYCAIVNLGIRFKFDLGPMITHHTRI